MDLIDHSLLGCHDRCNLYDALHALSTAHACTCDRIKWTNRYFPRLSRGQIRSNAACTTTNAMSQRCKNLVLDSGPLLSLSPLRGLADTYLTVPQVLDELKDKRAREHFEQLGLSTGVRVSIRNPDPGSLTQGTCQVPCLLSSCSPGRQ